MALGLYGTTESVGHNLVVEALIAIASRRESLLRTSPPLGALPPRAGRARDKALDAKHWRRYQVQPHEPHFIQRLHHSFDSTSGFACLDAPSSPAFSTLFAADLALFFASCVSLVGNKSLSYEAILA